MANAWGKASWGQNAWNKQSDVDQTPTGVSSTGAVGSTTVIGNCTVTVTGISVSSNVGTGTFGIAVDPFTVTGVSVSSSVGSCCRLKHYTS